MITASLEVGRKPDRRDDADRRFYGVVIASLLLHVVGFAVLLYFEQHRGSEPPRLIMVDMTTVVPPEPKAVEVTTPPEAPLPSPPKIKTPAPAQVPLATRQAATPVATAPPVPVAAIGETTEPRAPAARAEMTVPVAPPAARKPVETAPTATGVAVAPAPPAKPADHAEKLAKARASYRAMIAALIDRNKEYPIFARKAGQQGTCSIRCTMYCSGEVKSVTLVRSSGYDALDKAGIRAVQNVGKFPPPPTDGACTEVSFEVPITFRLS